jgi:ribonuclease J
MHASEEDLKMMVALLKPRYYIPVKGFYKDLLANAEVALSMGINLNHNNVFLLENGFSAIFDQSGAHIFDEKIVHGDIMIDGIGVGDVGSQVIDDREKLSQGVVILAVTVSKSKPIRSSPDPTFRSVAWSSSKTAMRFSAT